MKICSKALTLQQRILGIKWDRKREIPASPRNAFSTATPRSSNCLCFSSTCSSCLWMIWGIKKQLLVHFLISHSILQHGDGWNPTLTTSCEKAISMLSPGLCGVSWAPLAWPASVQLSELFLSTWHWVPPRCMFSAKGNKKSDPALQ